MRLDQLADWAGDRVQIEWRSFLLRPRPEERSMEVFTRYTTSWSRPAATEPEITFNTWSGQHQPPSHSMPSSVAGKLAETYGPEHFHAFHFGLLEAYFVDNRTVSEPDVLVDVARAAGLDSDDFGRRLEAEQRDLTNAVIDDHNAAVEAGVSGVPAVVVNDAYPITGAQDLDLYQRIVDKLAS